MIWKENILGKKIQKAKFQIKDNILGAKEK